MWLVFVTCEAGIDCEGDCEGDTPSDRDEVGVAASEMDGEGDIVIDLVTEL